MSRPASPAREVDAVAERLHSAALHLLRRLRIEDEALGISPPRLSALSVVVFAGPIPIGELAAAEGVQPPTMTRLVDGLERDGHVKRQPDPGDRRGVVVHATPKGVKTLTRGRARRVEVLASQLRALPRRDLVTLATAADLLERVARTRVQE